MLRVLRLEMERAFRSKGLTLALLIGYTIVIIHAIKVVYPYSQDILKWYSGGTSSIEIVYKEWFAAECMTPYRSIYLYLLPILSTLPFGVTYFTDRKGGYIKEICTRCKRSHYLIAKYISTFISGGVAVALPVIVGLIIGFCLLPAVNPFPGGNFPTIAGCMFGTLYYAHPFLFCLLYIFMYFMMGGAFACVALVAAYICDYSFFVLAIPFGIYYGLGILARYTRTDKWGLISPRAFLRIASLCHEDTYIIFMIVLIVLTFFIYYIGGKRRDIF